MDIKLSYIEKGSGFPLILLHGNGEEHSFFEHQIDYFSEFYRVIAIDTRGHGKSPRGVMPFTISAFRTDSGGCPVRINTAFIGNGFFPKEASETGKWLEMLLKTDYITQDTYKKLNRTCSTIRILLIASIKTAKSKL